MADLLENFKEYFVSRNLVEGLDVHLDTLFDSPDDAIAIFEYAGSSPLPQLNALRRSMQIVVRSRKPEEAQRRASMLYRALLEGAGEDGVIQLTSERWGLIHVRQPPFKFRVDDKGRTHYVFNLGIYTYFK